MVRRSAAAYPSAATTAPRLQKSSARSSSWSVRLATPIRRLGASSNRSPLRFSDVRPVRGANHMLERILKFSIHHRFLVVMLALAVAGIGVWSLQRLPIDAVPDITNNQVQINTLFAALSPVEVEKQITFPVETALAGIPGLQSTRSLSRNGFSQVTAIFNDDVDIYFAPQQINERLTEA